MGPGSQHIFCLQHNIQSASGLNQCSWEVQGNSMQVGLIGLELQALQPGCQYTRYSRNISPGKRLIDIEQPCKTSWCSACCISAPQALKAGLSKLTPAMKGMIFAAPPRLLFTPQVSFKRFNASAEALLSAAMLLPIAFGQESRSSWIDGC